MITLANVINRELTRLFLLPLELLYSTEPSIMLFYVNATSPSIYTKHNEMLFDKAVKRRLIRNTDNGASQRSVT